MTELKRTDRSRSTITSQSASNNTKRVKKKRGDYTEGFYSSLNSKKGTVKSPMNLDSVEIHKHQSAQDRKENR